MGFMELTKPALRGTRTNSRSAIVLILIILCLTSLWRISEKDRKIHQLSSKLVQKPFGSALTMQLPPNSAQRWALIHKTFAKHNPGKPLQTNVENAGKGRKYSEYWNDTSECARPETDLIKLEPKQLEVAKKAHEGFLEDLPELAKAFTFQKGTRGIVVTTGGDGNTVLVVSLKEMRATGCTLPVEVFFDKWSDWEPKLCEKVYPALGARCVYLGDDILDVDTPEGFKDVEGYQVKAFVMLMSSFEEILFLDADSFPIVDPEPFFDSEPFKTTGMITWPDYWCASQSKLWYEITGATEIPATERASSESGELMYDKTRHIKDLLLASYYNYYGPGLWWSLLSQGFAGEGDKETFLAAADVLNAPSYQISQPPIELPEKDAPGQAIPQANPAEDYAMHLTGKDWRKGYRASYAFIHDHWPKANAEELMHADFTWVQPGSHGRFWGSKEWLIDTLGKDWEHEHWKAIEFASCSVGHMFRAWEGKDSSCDFVQKHIGFVFEPDRPFSASGAPLRKVIEHQKSLPG